MHDELTGFSVELAYIEALDDEIHIGICAADEGLVDTPVFLDHHLDVELAIVLLHLHCATLILKAAIQE